MKTKLKLTFLIAILFSLTFIHNQVSASEITGTLAPVFYGTRTIVNGDPTIMQNEVSENFISVESHNPTATEDFVFNVKYLFIAGNATITFPAATVVSKSDGGDINLTSFSAADKTTELNNEIGSVIGAVKIGIPDLKLTFSKSITISILVGTDYDDQTLTVYYRPEGSTYWNTETTCTINGGYCTFQTNHATTFFVQKNESGNSSTDNSASNNNNSTSTPICNSVKPVSSPDLFQIDVNSSTAKLFFTPISNTNTFYVSYFTKPLAEGNGTEVSLTKEGVQSYTVYLLKPNTTYYFKIRGQIGCMPGDWSNIMKITTRTKGITQKVSFYKNIFSRARSLFTTAKKIVSLSVTSILSNIPTVNEQFPSATPTSVSKTPIYSVEPIIPTITPVPVKRCILWWCF